MSSRILCDVALSKHHFSLHAINYRGKVILRKSVSRTKSLLSKDSLKQKIQKSR
ncbi:hypothetical protein L4D06_06870 [Enterovibrio makurazakiensis]|uniref:hypothetical protein n=1 Tax=Enterovibrio makurazakiensis TaxID=2910232 RepID=UPI003D1F84DB